MAIVVDKVKIYYEATQNKECPLCKTDMIYNAVEHEHVCQNPLCNISITEDDND